MARDQAVAHALADDEPPAAQRPSPVPPGERGLPLTRREREVAILIARGRSNHEIAVELVISDRTAETHVSNILARLGFTARAQVAAWAVEQGLLSVETP